MSARFSPTPRAVQERFDATASCAPHPAKCKRIDAFGDALPARDVAAVNAAGAAITFDAYMADVAAGQG